MAAGELPLLHINTLQLQKYNKNSVEFIKLKKRNIATGKISTACLNLKRSSENLIIS
jgi:hypothetical protein